MTQHTALHERVETKAGRKKEKDYSERFDQKKFGITWEAAGFKSVTMLQGNY